LTQQLKTIKLLQQNYVAWHRAKNNGSYAQNAEFFTKLNLSIKEMQNLKQDGTHSLVIMLKP